MAQDLARLLIVPGLKDSHQLAQRIHEILRDDYRMGEGVEILVSKKRSEVSSSDAKGQNSPLVVDFFPDMEVEVDIGRLDLERIVQDRHVAIVQYLYNPIQEGSVNDRVNLVLGMLDTLGKISGPHKSLVTPYTTYLRAHSIEKYERKGFLQFDSLTRMLEGYQRHGLKTMISIDPHSDKVKEVARDMGMMYRGMNPFRSARGINPAKLGFSGNNGKDVMARLRPFLERFTKMKKSNPNMYVVSVDSGVEGRAEYFVDRAFSELEDPYSRLVYFDKDRRSYDNSLANFKPFSRIKANNIDPNGTYIIMDDMFASGTTAFKDAKILKENGAKRVEVWTSHAVTSHRQVTKASTVIEFIDKIVCLDTVPQTPKLDIEYIPASAHLLAAELYKSHEALHTRMTR
jgi:phosphoribosylpyrophosphate synthetase